MARLRYKHTTYENVVQEYYGIKNEEWADPQVLEEALRQAALHFEQGGKDEESLQEDKARVRSTNRRHPNLPAGFWETRQSGSRP